MHSDTNHQPREAQGLVSKVRGGCIGKRNCISETALDLNHLINFLVAIENGYNNITYHNKTHGADLV